MYLYEALGGNFVGQSRRILFLCNAELKSNCIIYGTQKIQNSLQIFYHPYDVNQRDIFLRSEFCRQIKRKDCELCEVIRMLIN